MCVCVCVWNNESFTCYNNDSNSILEELMYTKKVLFTIFSVGLVRKII